MLPIPPEAFAEIDKSVARLRLKAGPQAEAGGGGSYGPLSQS